MAARRWNSNLHAFEILMTSIPAGARTGLDVGCGEGETARRLREHVGHVVGVDSDPPSIELARRQDDDIDYVLGDLLTVDLPESSFDVVTAVGVLHHVEQAPALERLASLVRPGGRLLVVGFARSRTPRDFGRDAIDSVRVRRLAWGRDVWKTPAPIVWPPPLTYRETEETSLRILPDATFDRVPFLRYGLTWTRPA